MYKTISTQEFEQYGTQSNSVNLIDVRDPYEFESGHIKGAVNIPLPLLEHSMDLLPKDQHYHIICLTGNRSGVACEILDAQGYSVTNVMGGMSIYKGDLVL